MENSWKLAKKGTFDRVEAAIFCQWNLYDLWRTLIWQFLHWTLEENWNMFRGQKWVGAQMGRGPNKSGPKWVRAQMSWGPNESWAQMFHFYQVCCILHTYLRQIFFAIQNFYYLTIKEGKNFANLLNFEFLL